MERLILCRECGTKNQISRYKTGLKCSNCNRPLIVPRVYERLSLYRKPLIWLVIGGLLGGSYLLATGQHQGNSQISPEKPMLLSESSNEPPFSNPQVPIATGIMQAPLNAAVAPLNIKTSIGSNYYVKLVNLDEQTVMTMYIKGGQYLETKVPLGTYEMRYATGKVWYGTVHLFGPETSYAKADIKFQFDFDGQQYSGYTVELIRQIGGNLGTSPLSPSDF